jgi:hypothetical protein
MGILFTAILALVATDAMAQRGGPDDGDRPRGGRFGGPGGGRGPGGPRMGGPGMGGGIMGLLRVQEVREEIELMPDQAEALRKVAEEQPRMRPPEGIDFRDRSEANRAKLQEWMEKVRKQREENEKKIREQLEQVLLPQQMERLNQISVQTQGVFGLISDDELASKLEITTEQKEQMREKAEKGRDEMREKMREIFTSGNREGIREKMEEAQKELEKEILSVLNSSQTKKYEEMKGEPFEMPRPQFGRRGGGPGGPGGRGGFRGGRGGGPDGDDRGRRRGRGDSDSDSDQE